MSRADSKRSSLSPLALAIIAGGVLLAVLLLVVLYQPQQEDIGALAIIPQQYDCRANDCGICKCQNESGQVYDEWVARQTDWTSCVRTTAELKNDAEDACQTACEVDADPGCHKVTVEPPRPSVSPSGSPTWYTCKRTGSCTLPDTSPAPATSPGT